MHTLVTLATLATLVTLTAGCSRSSPSSHPPVVEAAVTSGSSSLTASESRVLTEEHFELDDIRLATFSRGPGTMRAVVLSPPRLPARRYPTIYVVHGFGGDHESTARNLGPEVRALTRRGEIPPLIWVFLDASHEWGHHAFADSENMGPWGTALVGRFIPAIEARFGGAGDPSARFTMGHSSGGWSSLWMQVAHPAVFGGVCSSAPDPVDFREFAGVDLYRFDNMYRDPAGDPTMLVKKDGRWVASVEQFVREEVAKEPKGGQYFSFDAVFSPRGEDGAPRPLFDRDSGAIDPEVVEAWKAYDISRKLRREWSSLSTPLAGKLNIIVGTEDTFGLDAAVRRLADELKALGSDADITFVPGRHHFDLHQPHPELYPQGLLSHCVHALLGDEGSST